MQGQDLNLRPPGYEPPSAGSECSESIRADAFPLVRALRTDRPSALVRVDPSPPLANRYQARCPFVPRIQRLSGRSEAHARAAFRSLRNPRTGPSPEPKKACRVGFLVAFGEMTQANAWDPPRSGSGPALPAGSDSTTCGNDEIAQGHPSASLMPRLPRAGEAPPRLVQPTLDSPVRLSLRPRQRESWHRFCPNRTDGPR